MLAGINWKSRWTCVLSLMYLFAGAAAGRAAEVTVVGASGSTIPPNCSLVSDGSIDSIDLPDQGYTGTIPTELGLCSTLTNNVYLANNVLTKTIPSELGLGLLTHG